jgi:hypothetical protein
MQTADLRALRAGFSVKPDHLKSVSRLRRIAHWNYQVCCIKKISARIDCAITHRLSLLHRYIGWGSTRCATEITGQPVRLVTNFFSHIGAFIYNQLVQEGQT